MSAEASCVMYFLLQIGLFAAGDVPAPVLAYLHARQRVAFVVESAGLFWIGAELLILFMVVAGRRHISTEPLPERFVLQINEKRRAIIAAVVFTLTAAAVLARHFAPWTVDADAAAEVLSDRMHAHMLVWASFVTVWVLLETLIVYHGWRGYCRLRDLLPDGGARPTMSFAAFLLIPCAAALFTWPSSAAPPDAVWRAIRDVNASDQVYWNALYLYLRLAGILWIAVEWWAAVILIKGYRMLARAVSLRGAAS